MNETGGIPAAVEVVVPPRFETSNTPEFNQALSVLVGEGFLANINGNICVDPEKFKYPLGWNELSKKLGEYAKKNGLIAEKVLTSLSNNLGKIYSVNDFDGNGLIKPEANKKPLFYIPENADDALSKEKIKVNPPQFHLGLWESTRLTEFYPTQNGDKLKTGAVIAATLIYHPQYGNGERTSEGKLIVTHPNGRRLNLSGHFFRKWGWYGMGIKNPYSNNNPKSHFGAYPEILNTEDGGFQPVGNEILKLDDFIEQTFDLRDAEIEASIDDFFTQEALQRWGREKCRALLILQNYGFLSLQTIPSSQSQEIIINPQTFTNPPVEWKKIAFELGELSRKVNHGKLSAIISIFANERVYSTNDLDNDGNLKPESSPKYMLYMPESEELAYDLDAVKSADFHLGIWQLTKGGYQPEYYPCQDGSLVPYHEATTIALLFHPNYGSGIRNEKGELIVSFGPNSKYRSDTPRRPVTGEFFNSWSYSGKEGNVRDPNKFLEEAVPRLRELGLLTESDFRQYFSREKPSPFRIKKLITHNKGEVMFNRVKYTLGVEYGRGTHWFVELGEGYAGIVSDSSGEVITIFKLQSHLSKEPGQFISIGKNEIDFYTPGELDFPTDLQLLINQYDSSFISISRELATRYNIRLAGMSLVEQAIVSQVYKDFSQDSRFWKFIENHGENGLKVLSLSQEGIINYDELIQIGNRERYSTVFENVSEIITRLKEHESNLLDYGTAIEVENNHRLTKATLTLTSQLLSSIWALDHNPQFLEAGRFSIHDAINNLYLLRQQVSRRYGNTEVSEYQFLLSQIGNMSESVATALLLGEIEQLWAIKVLEEAQIPGSNQFERALEQMVMLYESNPTLLTKSSDIIAMGRQRLLYRIIARGEFSDEQLAQAFGNILRHSEFATEVNILRQMMQDDELPPNEAIAIEKMTQKLLGIYDKVYADIRQVYGDIEYASTEANNKVQESIKSLFSTLVDEYGINKAMSIVDLGAGNNWFVNWLIENGYNAKGIEYSPKNIQDAQALFPDAPIEEGSWFHQTTDADVVTINTNGVTHGESPKQQRTIIHQTASALKPGGFFIFSSPNPMKPDSYINNKVMEHRRVLQLAFNLSPEETQNSWVVVDGPKIQGIQYNRYIQPREDIEKEIAQAGLELVEVISQPMPHTNDEQLVYVTRKPMQE